MSAFHVTPSAEAEDKDIISAKLPRSICLENPGRRCAGKVPCYTPGVLNRFSFLLTCTIPQITESRLLQCRNDRPPASLSRRRWGPVVLIASRKGQGRVSPALFQRRPNMQEEKRDFKWCPSVGNFTYIRSPVNRASQPRWRGKSPWQPSRLRGRAHGSEWEALPFHRPA